jgi:hypothetical protein
MARAMLTFAIFWDAISFTIFGVFLADMIRKPSLDALGGLAFISLFVAIGVVMLLSAIQLAFRKAVILATRQSLVFTQTGPVRKVEYQWTAAELAAVRCANSGTEVNDRPLKQLQIGGSGGTAQRGVLTGRDEAELEWLAATLRWFYRVGA